MASKKTEIQIGTKVIHEVYGECVVIKLPNNFLKTYRVSFDGMFEIDVLPKSITVL